MYTISKGPLMLLTILISLLSYGHSLRDLTVAPYASGEDVVDAVIAIMDLRFNNPNSTLWTEGDDSVFFKDMAKVESNYGAGENAFSAEELGGIWQVPWREFEDTKNTVLIRENSDYANNVEQISNAFDITWQNVNWEELMKPLHSVLAARLILYLRGNGTSDAENGLCDTVPTTDEKGIYAEYWYQCYRNRMRGDVAQFEAILGKGEVCSFSSDVAFVLDSSGSINNAHPDNWNRVKYFTGNFTSNLLGRSNTQSQNQVGIISYSSGATINSLLRSDRDALLNDISNLPYLDSSTNTAEGLCTLLDMNWRDESLRLAIVMTDGRSNRISSRCGTTIDAPEIVNTQLCPPPLYYVIGVTDNVDETELQAIATGPEYIDYLDSLENTAGLAKIRRQQTYQICFKASSLFCDEELIKTNFSREDQARYQVNLGEGVTIRLCVNQGQIVLYASTNIPTPNRAYNTFSFESGLLNGVRCEDIFINPSVIEPSRFSYSRNKRQASIPTSNSTLILYIVIEGVAENSSFILETLPGNSSLFSTSCSGRPCGANTVCVDEVIGYSCNCLPGYEFEPNLRDCKDANECQRQPFPCGLSAHCKNTNGSFECTCHSGYSGDGKKCALQENTGLEFIVTVACGVGGGVLVVLVVVLAAFISIYKAMVAKKDKKDRRASYN